ncbi:MAG: hypothetical protein FD180_2544 [Planctomycetota bacterium]|nr:MAG: hypothetical protein FD180_2544 [Planctomycetota bacterium]
MGGNGCSCAGAPSAMEAASLPEPFSTGRTVVIWDLMSLVQGTTDFSEAVPVPPNNAIAVEVNVLNFTVGATCTGTVQTCMDPAKEAWIDAGNLTINALGPNFTIITGISGFFIRVSMTPQSGTTLVFVCVHLPSR